MTNKEKIEYLKEYRSLVNECAQIIEHYNFLKNKIMSPGCKIITDMPTGNAKTKDKIAEYIAELQELEEEISIIRKSIINKYIAIENCIRQLNDSSLRLLMHLRYFAGMSWESICIELKYAWAQTHRLHSKALNQLDIKHKDSVL